MPYRTALEGKSLGVFERLRLNVEHVRYVTEAGNAIWSTNSPDFLSFGMIPKTFRYHTEPFWEGNSWGIWAGSMFDQALSVLETERPVPIEVQIPLTFSFSGATHRLPF